MFPNISKVYSYIQSEAEYAFSLHKDIIPLMMQLQYTPDGWLGLLRGSKIFYDFSGL